MLKSCWILKVFFKTKLVTQMQNTTALTAMFYLKVQ